MILDSILNDLKKTGYKLTVPRREISNVLSASNPLGAQEISEILKQKGFNVDVVTIYRSLELFHSLGIINKVKLEDKTTRYELVSKNQHHHHLVCIKCGMLEEVEGDENLLLKQINQKTDFKILRHSLEFFGFCRSCQ